MTLLDLQGLETPGPETATHGGSNTSSTKSCRGGGIGVGVRVRLGLKIRLGH
ncbi:SapB/AmfS family lanthipeptide [Streptomyces sp. CB03238]|uniref:SapB/AmfS family lanthipeptide n=1 Tax=Streptomyces sp. CB03238 TaxID=1907777 RepID=UPI000D1AD838|nr:SapB/AmfS family lanthipeptide [Streptomyces sp. CB03238]